MAPKSRKPRPASKKSSKAPTKQPAEKSVEEPAKKPEEPFKKPDKQPRKRRSSTLDRGEHAQVAATPSRLRLNGPRETPVPKSTPLRLNGPRRESLHLNFRALKGTNATNETSPPPPTPPAIDLTQPVPEWPHIQPREAPQHPRGRFHQRLLAAEALNQMGTPTPSQWFDRSATITSIERTQDYFTGTQQEHERRSQDGYFEGVSGEANRPWTQYEEEDKEETVVGNVVSRTAPTPQSTTAPTQRSKTTVGENRTRTRSPVDDDVQISYRLLTRCFYEGKSVHSGRQNPTIVGTVGSTVRLRDLIAEESQRAKIFADNLGFAYQRVSMRAVTSHARTPAKEKLDSELDIEEKQSFWNQLEDDIRRWYDQKKTDLTITFTSHWGRRSDGVIPPTIALSQEETSTQGSRPKTTSTSKLQSEMREYQARQTPAQQLNQDLLLKWRCLKMGCNEGRHCYVDGKEEHLPMNPAHIQELTNYGSLY